ncbi:MAG: toll/interleukin-1 receptor domain-containing protein, partial [Methylococcus sp.]
MPMTANLPKPKVFISYAHESETFRDQVRELADWLGQHGCELLTDHPYLYRPPPEGWQAWMLGCIDRADIVLVVCTPKLKARYEKTAEPDTGLGATYEGSIVTQHIYNAAMRNTKFYPILPDGGDMANVPLTLQAWWNGHYFPKGNENIRRMIVDPDPTKSGERTDSTQADGSDAARSAANHHQARVARLLDAPGARSFREAVFREFAEKFSLTRPASTVVFVREFMNCPCDSESVRELFDVVWSGLESAPTRERDHQARQATEEAAAALYCLAACRLVNSSARTSEYVLRIPHDDRFIAALVTMAVAGGELRLQPGDNPSIPCPKYAFDVEIPVGSERIEANFDRALYAALFPKLRNTTSGCQEDKPLSTQEKQYLVTRLRRIQVRDKAALALVIKGLSDSEVLNRVASGYQTHMVLPSPEVAGALLRLEDAEILLAELGEFWEVLQIINQPDARPDSGRKQPFNTGETPMTQPSNQVTFNINAPVGALATTTGPYSPATV